MNIAVTGCFGSGKSTVSRLLAQAIGAKYLDTDRLCREMLDPGKEGYLGLLSLYGSRFIGSDGTVDRVQLRRAVFSIPQVKESLETILHPLVRRLVADSARSCLAVGLHQVVEVPLLFEVGWQGEFDRTVVVSGEERQLLARVTSRDRLSPEEIRQIAATQMTSTEKERLGDFVISNTGIFAATVQQVSWLAKRLLQLDKLVREEPKVG